MATPLQNKELVKQAYPYRKWWDKVDKMTDSQIYVLLIRLRNQGKI